MKKGDKVLVRAIVENPLGMIIYPGFSITQRMGKPGKLRVIHTPPFASEDGEERTRSLWRFEFDEPWLGLVTGYSLRQTGVVVGAGFDPGSGWTEPYLLTDKYHRVVMVQPLRAQRWFRPSACLEEDLEIVE